MAKKIKNAVKALHPSKTVKTTAKRKGKKADEARAENTRKRTGKSKPAPEKGKPNKKLNQAERMAEIGSDGENQIYDILVRVFGEMNVFRNVYVRRSSGRLTEIDLLAIHPTGVYVIESKNYSGFVRGDGNDREWLHIKGNNYRRTFYSPVAQNAGHVDALREACQYHVGFIPPMLSLLVFPDRCELQILHLPLGLRCCRLSQMKNILFDVFKMVTPVLSPQHMLSLKPLFYQSQRSMLPPSVQAQHMRDVAAAKQWANSQ